MKPITSLCHFATASRFFFKPRTRSGGSRVRSQEGLGSDIVWRPIAWLAKDLVGVSVEDEVFGGVEKAVLSGRGSEDSEEEVQEEEEEEEEGVDWEDKILEDTVPMVGFVRMILHSGRFSALILYYD
ncbi:hypothetical protein NL676_006352 [Syzygium grande]|nr:hypothetical protein NL676_006352 [Syzygium grande]